MEDDRVGVPPEDDAEELELKAPATGCPSNSRPVRSST
jgi:hypothetical protein